MERVGAKRRANDIGRWLWREEQLPQRAFFYVLGLFFAAFGVVLAVNSDLGLSPVSSFPFVLSRITGLYMGTLTTLLLLFFLALQILILRKEFKWINLTQMIFAIIFGYFVDFIQLFLGDAQLPTYFGRLGMLGFSIVLIVIGLILFLDQKIVPMPAEGFLEAIVKKYPNRKFHQLKVILDCTFVTLAALLSLLFLGSVVGLREGTVISAIFIGKLFPPFRKYITNPMLQKFGIRLR